MANLNNTQIIIKGLIFPILILAGIVTFSFLIYLNYFKKDGDGSPKPQLPPPTITQTVPLSSPKSFEVSENLELPDTPDKLAVYTITETPLTDDFAETIASNLKITTPPKISENTTLGKQYIYSTREFDLTINKLDIWFKDFSKIAGPEKRGENQLQQTAAQYLNSFNFINQEFVQNSNYTEYLTVEDDRFRSSSRENATYFKFYFDLKINGIPIVKTNQFKSFSNTTITQDGNIVGMTMGIPASFTENSTHELKDPSDAIEEVVNGNGQLISALLLDDFEQAVELFSYDVVSVREATINKAHLSYLYPENTAEMLQPIYVFEASFRSNNRQGKAIIYLPAISTRP